MAPSVKAGGAQGGVGVPPRSRANARLAGDIVVDDPEDMLADPAAGVLVKATAKRYVAADPDMRGWTHEHQLLFRLVVDILNGVLIVRATDRDAEIQQSHAERLREAFCSVRWNRDKIAWVTNTIVDTMPRVYSKYLSKLYSLLKKYIPAPLHDRLTVPSRDAKADSD